MSLLFEVAEEKNSDPPADDQLLAGLFSAALDPAGARASTVESSLQIDGFDVFERIGRGGGGSVWRAHQHSTGRDVALKLLGLGSGGSSSSASATMLAALADEDGEGYQRFRREVEIVASLDHPNIAKVFESGLGEDLPYFAMELVTGSPLDAHADAKNLDQRQRLELFRKVCSAVQHAHQNGVIHRDLKPNNILVAETSGEPKVLDFGLAKAFDGAPAADAASLQGKIAGTPIYMSPEQAGGNEAIDTRSDVYSLGVILYRLLTGKFPYSEEGSELAIARRVTDEEPAKPVGVDDEIEALLIKALAKNPASRYANAGALADDVQRYLSGLPLEAKLPTVFYQLKKHASRHRAAWIGSLAALLVGAAAVLFYIGQLRQSEARQRTLTEEAQKERGNAETKSREMAELAGEMRLRLAHDALDRSLGPEALLHLAAALRTDPGNRFAAELAGNLLLHRVWPLPTNSPTEEDFARRVRSEFQPRWVTIDHASRGDLGPMPVNSLQVHSKDGRPIGPILKHQAATVMSTLTADGRLLASYTSSNGGHLYLWEATKGVLLAGPLFVGSDYLRIGFDSREQSIILMGGKDSNTPAMRLALRLPLGLLSRHQFDERVFHAALEDGLVQLYHGSEVTEFLPRAQPLEWDAGSVRHLAQGGVDEPDGFFRLPAEKMEAAALLQLKEMGIEPPAGSQVAISPDGKRYAVARPLRIHTTESGSEPMEALDGMMNNVADPIWFNFSADGGTLFLVNAAGEVRIWDIEGKRWGSLANVGGVVSVCMDGRESVAYMALTSGRVVAVDLKKSQPKWVGNGASAMTSVRHLPEQGRVLALSYDGDLGIWDDKTGEKLGRSHSVGADRLFLPVQGVGKTGRVLVQLSGKGNRVWDWQRQQPLSPWFGSDAHPRAVSADWKTALVSGLANDKEVLVYQLFVPDADAPQWFIDLIEQVGAGTYLQTLATDRDNIPEAGVYADLVRRFVGE